VRTGDLRPTLIALVALVLWELAGLDRLLSGLLAGPEGFALRDARWLVLPFHEGLRLLAGAIVVWLAYRVWRPGRLSRSVRSWWLAVSLLCLVGIAGLKTLSPSSCPWDLADYGGRFPWVPHWMPGAGDGGPARCFPSGHATVGYAFFAGYFAWRVRDRRHARRWLVAALVIGSVAGATQVLRGAHFASHVGWTAWLCWSVTALLYQLGPGRPTD
jgi:membrane-associated PAP2 superfamily phosphatase